MHPSRPVSGPPTALNAHDAPQDSSASFIQAQRGQPAADWYYPPSDDTPAAPSSSSMIGPTSTFYNSDDAALQHRSGHEYQQWLDTYGAQPQQTQQIEYQPYSRGPPPQTEIQNPYDYIQGQYSSSSSLSQYAGSTTGTVTQAPVNDSTYFQTADIYSPQYRADLLTTTNTSTSSGSSPEHGHSYHTSTPESTHHSYSNSPDPVYQQQQQQRQQQQQQQQQRQQQQQQQQQQQPQPQPQQQQPQPQQHQQRHQQQHNRPFPVPPQRRQAPRPAQQKPVQPPQFQQAQPLTFLRHQPQISQSSTAAPQAPSRNAEATYPSKNPVTAAVPTFSPLQYTPPVPQASGSKPGPSQTQPAPAKHTNVITEPPSQAPVSASTVKGAAPERVGVKRKRARKNESPEWSGFQSRGDQSDSESDDDDGSGLGMSGGIGVGLSGLGVIGRGKREKGSRLPGACTHCKKLKMKCDFPRHENTCKRCKSGGHVCIVEGRRPRTAPNKREYLLAQIRQKDAIIESLLKQLHNPYIATPLSIASYRMATSPSDHNNRNVLAWLDRLQSSVREAGQKAGPKAFLELRNLDGVEEESDVESESKRTQVDLGIGGRDKNVTTTQGTGGGDEASQQDDEDDKLQSSLPEAHVPLGLIADLSLSNNKANRKKEGKVNEDDLNDDNVGVANETYFMPGPATDLGIRATLIEQHSAPEILVHGLVKPEDVEKLFEIFYQRVNPFISLLDPVLHTPASTFARCPFLFTVICAISSRYYAEKSEIYPIAMHFAKHSAANALIDGWKSVELCQAYILMSIYAVPARRWEEDRSWLYTGLAIRIATDLNLHHVSTTKPTSENQEREILNKTRVWMICFNLDRSTATQFGKPSTIKEDFIVRGAKEWYKKSQYNHPYDVHLCAYSALMQIVAKFHDEVFSDPSSPTGLNKKVNFRAVTLTHDAHLKAYHEEWAKRFKEDSDPDDLSCALRCSLLPFLVGYSRLVMFSFGFQQAYQRGFEDGDSIFFTTCLDAAKSVIQNMIEGLAQSGYMRYAPDGHFVFSSFASAFLLKLLKPEFSSFLVKEQENEIFDLIGRLIQTLSSPKIAIDDRHTPKLYARFLAGLLSRHRRDGATVGRLQTNPPPSTHVADTTQPPVTQPPPPTSSRTTGGGQPMDQSFSQAPTNLNQVMDTPIYMPEATFAASTGQIDFGADYEMSYGGNIFSDEEMLATMQAIKNPAWWETMMMPGFSWPEGSPSPPANNMVSSAFHSLHPPAIHSNFGIFHGAQVIM